MNQVRNVAFELIREVGVIYFISPLMNVRPQQVNGVSYLGIRGMSADWSLFAAGFLLSDIAAAALGTFSMTAIVLRRAEGSGIKVGR